MITNQINRKNILPKCELKYQIINKVTIKKIIHKNIITIL